MAAEWATLIERFDIHQAGSPSITAVALTSPGQLEEEQRLTRTRMPQDTEKYQAGSSQIYSLRRQGQHIATTELLDDESRWVHWATTGVNCTEADQATVNAALILARAYRTVQCQQTGYGLNPLLPNPDAHPFADERIRRAAQLGRQASAAEYDPENPLSRSVTWAECFEQARLGALEPVNDASLHEVAFALQLAVNAAIMCQRYDESSLILPHAMAMGRNVRQLAPR